MSDIRKKIQSDNDTIENLLNKTFGPGRYARSVYRLRENKPYLDDYSYVCSLNGKILASISFCETLINNSYTGLLLGPLAVEPNQVGKGYGKKLVKYSLDKISINSQFYFIIVVGEYDYYKEFGFNKLDNHFVFYGPVNKNRVLIKINKSEMKLKDMGEIIFS